jgi:hypothetical protein
MVFWCIFSRDHCHQRAVQLLRHFTAPLDRLDEGVVVFRFVQARLEAPCRELGHRDIPLGAQPGDRREIFPLVRPEFDRGKAQVGRCRDAIEKRELAEPHFAIDGEPGVRGLARGGGVGLGPFALCRARQSPNSHSPREGRTNKRPA